MNKEEFEKFNVDVVSIKSEKGSLKDDAARLPLDLSIEEVVSLNELF